MAISNQFSDPTHVSFITPGLIQHAIADSNLEISIFKPRLSYKKLDVPKRILRIMASILLKFLGINLNLDYLATRNCFCVLKKKLIVKK